MDAHYTSLAVLDEMIAAGWGSTPRDQIPSDWRTKPAPPAPVLRQWHHGPRRPGERFLGAYREGLYRRKEARQ